MYLLQIFIPAADRESDKFPQEQFSDLKNELTQRFGGVTIYARAPVKGIWKPGQGSEVTDNMIIYEVLVPEPDLSYFSSLKSRLEETFHQQEIMMRYFSVSVVR